MTSATNEPEFSPSADELLANNARYAETYSDAGLAVAPRRKLAIVACMDSRMDIFQMFGLRHGEAHVIRNAGGVVTDDVVRSLCISQRLLGTQEIILAHHTNCGLQVVTEDAFKAAIEAETGIRPWWSVESFSDPYADVRQSMRRLQMSPFLPYREHIRGFVYEVDSGRLVEATLGD